MANLAVFNSAAFLTAGQLAVAANATIEVRREDTSALANIFSNEAGTTPITNPSAFADASGRFTFYAAGIARGYSIEVTSGAESFMLRNVAIGTAGQRDTTAFGASLLEAEDESDARNTLKVNKLLPSMEYGGAVFDGSTNYLDGNPLSGITDTKKGSLVWFGKFDNAAASLEVIFGADTSGAGQRFVIRRLADGKILVRARNGAGTLILDVETTAAVCANAGVYKIMLSFDLAVAGSFKIYVNSVDQPVTETTFTNDTIDYTRPEWAIGAEADGANKFDGIMYLIAFTELLAIDYDDEERRREVIDADSDPVFMGPFGQLAFGIQPIVFLAYDGAPGWFSLDRSGNVSDPWVSNGTFSAPSGAANVLDGQYGPRVIRLLDSGSLPAAATVDIPIINTQESSRVVVSFFNVSFDTAARALHILNNTDTSGYGGTHIQDATASAVSTTLAKGASQAAGETTDLTLTLTCFHQGMPTICFYVFQSAIGGTPVIGSGQVGVGTLDITLSIRAQLSGSGNFDGGSYRVVAID